MKHFSQWKNSAKAVINKLKELQGNYYNKEFHMLWFNRIYAFELKAGRINYLSI